MFVISSCFVPYSPFHALSVSILGSERTYANQLSGLNYILPRHNALHMTVSSLPRTASQFFSHHAPKNNTVLHAPIFNWITDICALARLLLPSFPLFPYLVSFRWIICPCSAHRYIPSFLHFHSFPISSHLVGLSVLIPSIAQQVLIIYIYLLNLSSWMCWVSSPQVFRRCHRRTHLAFSLCACRMSFRIFGCYVAHDIILFGNCTLLVPAPNRHRASRHNSRVQVRIAIIRLDLRLNIELSYHYTSQSCTRLPLFGIFQQL
jgi:hypothetical protein